MWYKLGQFILKFRLSLLVILIAATAVMGYFASQVKLSYDFSRAVPLDNPKYIEYQEFLKRFNGDGNVLAIGFESNEFYTPQVFDAVSKLHQNLKKIISVETVLSIPDAITLVKDSVTDKLITHRVFNDSYNDQKDLDSAKSVFENLPFYKGILYNASTKSYLMLVTVNKDTINSKSRTRLINNINDAVDKFESESKIKTHISGLPYIRTTIGNKIKDEMNWFLFGSFLLSAITLFIFFRSFSATIMSLLVVGMGVTWSLGTMVLCGYKITLLTALIPPLIVVIGIPNCIYFLNKYHTSFKENNNKEAALINMVGRMGIVTLFCNIAAAIGFAVFAFTQSQLLKEFGVVAGINIMALFLISLIFIPVVLSYLPAPEPKHVRYLDNKFLEKILITIEKWALSHAKWVYAVTLALTVFAVMGIFRLRSEGFIVDDLPQQDKIYTDLKWFENNFKGVMPLEIIVDTKKNRGALKLEALQDVEALSNYIATKDETAKPLSIIEALKFANQGFYNGDSNSYALPIEIPASLSTALRKKVSDNKSVVTRLATSFIDSSQRYIRISVNMKDIGSVRLPILLNDLENKSKEIFDTASYKVTFTGSSVTFLEGSTFIIKGLKDSIFWAFVLIAFCMLFLFRSFRILLCSLIPNLIPLIITAGVMGWMGITLKPSTVIVFSVALGIVIDVTIRFLVNYKQELPRFNNAVKPTLVQTIRHTGISIIYTSLVLIAGFVIFCFSGFGGIKALGWLTSLTLVTGTLTNLILLPVLIIGLAKK
ncbi:multidrug resistance protein MdtC [mine drainage metagenome]|uniref:Multidrug resistance protein MdtC n=1 Tax=mine drainage metagenome TaxID=410659 RepID=A0A1J5TE49_9ZZZZ